MEEGQHIDQWSECLMRAALEALLTHFEVRGAEIQLKTIGWLGDHCKAKG